MSHQDSQANSSSMSPPLTPVLNNLAFPPDLLLSSDSYPPQGNYDESRVKMEDSNEDNNILLKDNKSAVEREMMKEDILYNNFQSIENEKTSKNVTKRKHSIKRKNKRKPVVNLKIRDKRKTKVRKRRIIRQKEDKKMAQKKRGRPRKIIAQNIFGYEHQSNIENSNEKKIKNNLLQPLSQATERKFSTSEWTMEKRMTLVRTTSQSNNSRMGVGREDFGTLVFAKIKGWRHWPAMIVNPRDAGLTYIPQGNACIFWIGDFRVSPVNLKKVKEFVSYFREDLIRPSLDENYINSVMIALKECCRRASETDVDTKNFGALLSWATTVFAKNAQIFRPRPGSSNYPPLIALCLRRIKKFEETQSREGQRAWKKKVETLTSVRNGITDIESVCISCTRPDVAVTSKHPVFEGGACQLCKDEELESNSFTDFDEIKHIICIICRCPCSEFTCDIQTCKLVYCEHCIELLVNVNAVETAKSSYYWKCYSCSPHKPMTHGLFKKRNHNILDSHTTDQDKKPKKMWGEYLVENVVSKRVVNDKERITTEYLIKWQGLSQEFNTWEPQEHMFGIQNLFGEYKRHLNSLPSSKRKFLEDLAKDESFNSCDQQREESSYILTSFNKRKRICPPKVNEKTIDVKNDVSHTTKLHDTHSSTKETNNSENEIENTNYGAMIWAKIQGFPWWPAMIVKEHLCGFTKIKEDEACVFWLGDNRVSKILLKDCRNFTTYCKKSMYESSNVSYMRAMEQALRICYERGRDSDIELYSFEEYTSWSRKAFRKDPHRFSPISVLDPYPPKINSLLKMIMNYREAQKEEKWEEERWELYDPTEPPKSELSSISSLFGRGNCTASKSVSSYDPNTTIQDHIKETTVQPEKSLHSRYFKSKKSFTSTSASGDSDDITSQPLKSRKPNRKSYTRVETEMLVNEDSWEVEQIVKHRRRKQKFEYLIKWRGYPSSQNTWEPRTNLMGCTTILRNYINSSEKLQHSMKNSKILSKQERQELLKIKNKQITVKKENNDIEHTEKQVATKSAELSPIRIQCKRCGSCTKCSQQENCDICKLRGINTTPKICSKHMCNSVKYQVCDVQTTDLVECRSKVGQQNPKIGESNGNEKIKEEVIQGARKEDMRGFETPPRTISKNYTECLSERTESWIETESSSANSIKNTKRQMKYDSEEISPVKREIELLTKIQKKETEEDKSKIGQVLRTPPKSSTRSPLKALIISAINDSDHGKLKIQDIYKWIEDKVPAFGTDEKNRKRIRDLLSHNRSFVKTGDDTPAYWKIANDDTEDSFVVSDSNLQDTMAMPEKIIKNEDLEEDNLQLNLSSSTKSTKSDDVIEVYDDSLSSSTGSEDEDEDENYEEIEKEDELEITKFKPSKTAVDILDTAKQKIYLFDSTHSKLVPYKLVPADGQPISFKDCNTEISSREKFKSSDETPPLIDLTDVPPIIDLTMSPVSSCSKLKTLGPSVYGEVKSKESVLKITPLSQKPALKPTPLPLKMKNVISSKKKSLWYKPLSLATQSISYNKEDVTVTVIRPLSVSSDLSLPSGSSEKDNKSSKDSLS